MSNKNTVARPYAKAVFEQALATRTLPAWSRILGLAATVVSDARVTPLLHSPHVTSGQLGEAVIDIVAQAMGSEGLHEHGRNFLRTLAENRRLDALPDIAAVYEHLRAESENIIDVTVTSASPLDERQQASYAEALRKRLKREVRLHTEVDPSLLGGAVLRADDLVIDGSVRGRLQRLHSELTG